ncbi:hypothetical protein VM1G_00079 [Cytospora mali]|uniref:EamA domain-containing protein n=1 Tax=Cytospora mali TaxID=578113 RepID=A0A194VMQ0_CYTMA|nr:hypothetical protein VM1G_00079 [Valsa mali]
MGRGEEEESLQPFLNGHDYDSRDASLELPELSHRTTHNDNNHNADSALSLPSSSSRGPSEQFEFAEGKHVLEKPLPPKRPAAYAIAFMLGAQVFSASMNVSIRLLENTSTQLHPLQILFVRMSITTLGITAWLWKQNKPDNILGKRENRKLLLVRAFGGFLGVFGLYYSLRYLNLSEATVITFMMPLVASFGGYLLLGSPFSWLEILLSIVSLFGVLLVASPDAMFPAAETDATLNSPDAVNLVSRIWALCVGLLGVCGSAAAFLCMSVIGKTENPLTVVNYFAALCAVVSVVALIVLPGLGFQAPGNIWEWTLLFFSGLSGFLMQFLITLSLQAEKSLVAVNMVYTQIVFALTLDGIVFHTIPHVVSLLGCALIMGSAVFLAWHKTKARSKAGNPEEGGGPRR